MHSSRSSLSKPQTAQSRGPTGPVLRNATHVPCCRDEFSQSRDEFGKRRDEFRKRRDEFGKRRDEFGKSSSQDHLHDQGKLRTSYATARFLLSNLNVGVANIGVGVAILAVQGRGFSSFRTCTM